MSRVVQILHEKLRLKINLHLQVLIYYDFIFKNLSGYIFQVIFADGTFVDGSTSELSCDGPLREPFAVFCQVSAS